MNHSSADSASSAGTALPSTVDHYHDDQLEEALSSSDIMVRHTHIHLSRLRS